MQTKITAVLLLDTLLLIAGCVPISPPAGQILNECQTDADCSDGVFCNGVEYCYSGTTCFSGDDPCPRDNCDESSNQCKSEAASHSAREICLDLMVIDLGDNPEKQSARDVFIDTLTSDMENLAEHGISPNNASQIASSGSCVETEGTWCVTCVVAIVNEVYDNYVPTPGALGICRRSWYPDDNVEALRLIMQLLRDEGTTKLEFFNIFVFENDICGAHCSSDLDFNEFFTQEDCFVGCSSCMLALADEVW